MTKYKIKDFVAILGASIIMASLVLGALAIVSFGVIAALNTLFPALAIAYNLKTIASVMLLLALFSRPVLKVVRE